MSDVLYLCDRRACSDKCSYPVCSHTTDIRHAKNFVLGVSVESELTFIEQEDSEE